MAGGRGSIPPNYCLEKRCFKISHIRYCTRTFFVELNFRKIKSDGCGQMFSGILVQGHALHSTTIIQGFNREYSKSFFFHKESTPTITHNQCTLALTDLPIMPYAPYLLNWRGVQFKGHFVALCHCMSCVVRVAEFAPYKIKCGIGEQCCYIYTELL